MAEQGMFMNRLFRPLALLIFSALTLAAEIALSGVDPTIFLTTNPPNFAFSVDDSGFFTSQYTNASGFTFLNLLITGPADGISSVGCSPDSIFLSCSASINRSTDLVTFTFSGGPGLPTNQSFLLTATNFVPGQTLSGTSTLVVGTPEPSTIALILAAVLAFLGLSFYRPVNFRNSGLSTNE